MKNSLFSYHHSTEFLEYYCVTLASRGPFSSSGNTKEAPQARAAVVLPTRPYNRGTEAYVGTLTG